MPYVVDAYRALTKYYAVWYIGDILILSEMVRAAGYFYTKIKYQRPDIKMTNQNIKNALPKDTVFCSLYFTLYFDI